MKWVRHVNLRAAGNRGALKTSMPDTGDRLHDNNPSFVAGVQLVVSVTISSRCSFSERCSSR